MPTYGARLKRIENAVALRESDRVPIAPPMQCYPVCHAGRTMKDVIYDFEKGAECFIKYAREYEPDLVWGQSYIHMGRGPVFELMKPKTLVWAGAPGARIPDASIHQFLEFPVLLEADMPFFERDYSGWLLQKGLPMVSGLMEPFGNFNFPALGPDMDQSQLAAMISTPEMRETIETLWKINDFNKEHLARANALDEQIEELGFPVLHKGGTSVPFDEYSDFFRGTLEAMVDMLDRKEMVLAFCKTRMEQRIQGIKKQGGILRGKWIFIALHKGMDKFMSDEQFRQFYWNDLRVLIEEIIANGMTPYVYTEGPYDTRLEALTEVTKGKAVYHFETVDMANAKKILGGTACISGGFPASLLEFGSKQAVIDECKRLIDICAPGGGFIFETGAGFDNVKPENVEAMFQTVKEYGKS
jgi:hypothetical protein